MSDIEPRLKALMLRSLDGDAEAYGALLEALSGYLRAYLARRLGSASAEAEDLVQETLLAIHLKRETYDSALPFTAWAYALAHYKLIDHFRRARRTATLPLDSVEDLFDVHNPEEGAVRRDLDKLLSRLPSRQRDLMRDVKLQGLSMEEAGAKTGMTGAAVRVSIHRSLMALTRMVRDEDR